ncbi:helix-turn-helix transcriptional regulator [Novosphingobium mangrovi (ex Hu et al. 2023)]|uniref:Helix-turn-helix domain-containing protein n=1 Tax=Novosphingobium mangrovi (ex Hu et al. 2023) TaxID=2930094 RepID=A0ABT0AAG5_9SPHN|nr:helix-turn-helix domain-containing protein [Novosphingobium mangrovi (ex Hu et al. 2023)]MCJ1960185.1 helix-turn-helix domain-containing protein [Novosphingobium mangrovi (ex Hu et al. 2023)]
MSGSIEYLSLNDIAQRLRVGVASVNQLIRNQLLPKPIMIGKQRRWLAHEVDEAMLRLREA